MTNYQLNIGWLYPDLMSTYGDRGNIICLQKRCQWRRIEVKIEEISLQSTVDSLQQCDLLFMGGAQDRQQKIAAQDLKRNKGVKIKEMTERGTPGLFICGAYQFMGHYYKPAEGENIPGLGIFDLYTIHPGKEKGRCIGSVVVRIDSSLCHAEFSSAYSSEEILKQVQDDKGMNKSFYLVGFENHGGRTYLGKDVEPLGKVIVGFGNNGGDKTEGCVYKNSIGTYFHGPVLPKNPHLADWLIKMALFKKYGNEVKLEAIDDSLEWQAHNFILKKYGK